MKRISIITCSLLLVLFTSLILITSSSSHSGRTDANGGHYNRKTGEYHYHNRPATRPATPSYQNTEVKEGTVYVTRTGKKYHASGCRYLSQSKIPMDIKTAKSRGYTACSVCGGVPVGNASNEQSGSNTNQYQREKIESVYHGNTSSKKFHKPSCRYYNCKNCTAVFSSRQKAIAAGYEPCKVCNP